MAGSLRSWIHYCDLRRGSGTQKEHIDIANKVWAVLVKEFKFLSVYEEHKNDDLVQLKRFAEKLGYSLAKL
jgi:thymidylate synthase ThyX